MYGLLQNDTQRIQPVTVVLWLLLYLQALAARRSLVYNQPDAAAVAAFLRASGRSSTCRLSWSDTTVTQKWTLQA